MKIGIVIVATRGYFLLGLRFMKKFMHWYQGKEPIEFHFFSDRNVKEYVSDSFPVVFHNHYTKDWVAGTNSKFDCILSLEKSDCDYLFYFDADTNIGKKFTEEWFLGDLVGGQHWGDLAFMKEKPFDRNPRSKAFVPKTTHLPQMYYYGAFFGGKKHLLMELMRTLKRYQQKDREIGYEPVWNDESYLNKEFHFRPPARTVLSKEFAFLISDKGGLENTRGMEENTAEHLAFAKENKDKVLEIAYGNVFIAPNT